MIDDRLNMESVVKVIHIAGSGRSGSTLLDLILGHADNFFSVGELIYIWRQGFVMNDPCSCGKKFLSCDFWNQVIQEAFGSIENLDIPEFLRLRKSVSRDYNIPFLILGWGPKKFWQDFYLYTQALSRLYSAIASVTGCQVIVDSSKYAVHSFITRRIPHLETFTIHLVRDSRGVAYSWQKKKLRHGSMYPDDYMHQYSPVKSAWLWLRENIFLNLYRVLYPQDSVFLRYEDLVTNTQRELADVLSKAGFSEVDYNILDGDCLNVEANHILSGNPLRFHRGELVISLDETWREEMQVEKILVSLITWPFLCIYNYVKRF